MPFVEGVQFLLRGINLTPASSLLLLQEELRLGDPLVAAMRQPLLQQIWRQDYYEPSAMFRQETRGSYCCCLQCGRAKPFCVYTLPINATWRLVTAKQRIPFHHVLGEAG